MDAERFTRFAAIDWSGAKGERLPGIAVATCAAGNGAPELVTGPAARWSRADVLNWIVAQAATPILIGLDLSPALPFVDQGAYFPGSPIAPADAKELWHMVDQRCASDPHHGAAGLLTEIEVSRHFRQLGNRGSAFPDGLGRLRRCEERQRDVLGLSPSSCFNLVGAAQVGKSSLTGMRVLHALDGRVPFWPFDPVPTHGALLVEIYTTIAARAAGRPKGRSKMATGEMLDEALTRATIGSDPLGLVGKLDDHQTDALLTAAWLRRVADDPALWRPAAMTPDTARTEGWTFGVP